MEKGKIAMPGDIFDQSFGADYLDADYDEDDEDVEDVEDDEDEDEE